MRHRHPQLARPITRAQFEREILALWEHAGFRGLPRVVVQPGPARCNPPPDVRRAHARSERRYATVELALGAPPVFYFAPAILALPRANRLGLVAHELGHALLDGPHTEADADAVAREVLGVSITYDRRGWPGRGLQRGRA